jgi:hypothetical protein
MKWLTSNKMINEDKIMHFTTFDFVAELLNKILKISNYFQCISFVNNAMNLIIKPDKLIKIKIHLKFTKCAKKYPVFTDHKNKLK